MDQRKRCFTYNHDMPWLGYMAIHNTLFDMTELGFGGHQGLWSLNGLTKIKVKVKVKVKVGIDFVFVLVDWDSFTC